MESSKPFSAELHAIRRLNSSLHRAAGRDRPVPGLVNSPSSGSHPTAEHAALAPSRREVPLFDPCCWQLSAGAEVDLGIRGRQKLLDFHHVVSELWSPPEGVGERPQTAPEPSGICMELSEDKTWNSLKASDAAGRARSHGAPNPVNIQHHSLRTPTKAVVQSPFPDKHTGAQDAFASDLKLWTDKSLALRRFRYTSATQRSYDEVGWDSKLPRRFKAPAITLERMSDPVAQRRSSRRYNSQPQLWQSVGAEWNRVQLRSRHDARKPVSFCSGCPRSGQIPLYSGTIGSENMDNIDNMEVDFRPLTLKRSIVPRSTLTARHNIPGYTGKAAYGSSAAVPAVSSPARSRTVGGPERPVFGHVAPLSRLVTTAAPGNPSLTTALPASRTKTQGGFRQSK